jgi:transposase
MKGEKRKPYPSDLTAAQWEFINPLVRPEAHTGRPGNDDREVINGILYVLTRGCGWEYRPPDLGTSWRTCPRRLREYQRRRVWQKLVAALLKLADRKGQINLTTAYPEASVVKSKKGAKTQ